MSDSNKKYRCGHRQRMRQKYLEKGIDGFSQQEILEMMLFYSVPRVDTKPLAYKLIEEYGSVEAVIQSRPEQLVKSGLTPSGAMHLKLFHDVNAWINKNSVVRIPMKDYDKIGKYLSSLFKDKKTEHVVVLLLDSKDCLITSEELCEGSFTQAVINMRRLVEKCVISRAAKVVLAHNHPAGMLVPSPDDYSATEKAREVLSDIGVVLVEHYIVCGKDYIGIEKAKREQNQREKEHKNIINPRAYLK